MSRIVVILQIILVMPTSVFAEDDFVVSCEISGNAIFYESGADGAFYKVNISDNGDLLYDYNKNLLDPNSFKKKSKILAGFL